MRTNFPPLNEQELEGLPPEELQKQVKDWHYIARLLDEQLRATEKAYKALKVMDRFRFN